jgi:hypothetical protein
MKIHSVDVWLLHKEKFAANLTGPRLEVTCEHTEETQHRHAK